VVCRFWFGVRRPQWILYVRRGERWLSVQTPARRISATRTYDHAAKSGWSNLPQRCSPARLKISRPYQAKNSGTPAWLKVNEAAVCPLDLHVRMARITCSPAPLSPEVQRRRELAPQVADRRRGGRGRGQRYFDGPYRNPAEFTGFSHRPSRRSSTRSAARLSRDRPVSRLPAIDWVKEKSLGSVPDLCAPARFFSLDLASVHAHSIQLNVLEARLSPLRKET